MAALPSKANPILIVDANTVLSRPIALQRLQPVCRGRSKVPDIFGAIDLDQPAKGHFCYLAPIEDRFSFLVAKRADQTSIVLRVALNVKQKMALVHRS